MSQNSQPSFTPFQSDDSDHTHSFLPELSIFNLLKMGISNHVSVVQRSNSNGQFRPLQENVEILFECNLAQFSLDETNEFCFSLDCLKRKRSTEHFSNSLQSSGKENNPIRQSGFLFKKKKKKLFSGEKKGKKWRSQELWINARLVRKQFTLWIC